MLYKHSRWSIGEFIQEETVQKNWKVTHSNSDSGEKRQDEKEGTNIIPIAPTYSLYQSSIAKLKDVTVMNHDPITYQKKEEDKRCARVTKKNLKLQIDEANKLLIKKERNQFQCEAYRGTQRCTKEYTSSKRLQNHVLKGNHTYAALNSIDMAIQKATSDGGVLCAGNFVNTSNAVKRDLELLLRVDSSSDQDWCGKGCYNKPKRKPSQRMTTALKKDLEDIFQEGLQTNMKLSAAKTVIRLQEMRNPDGRLKYSYNMNNPNGPPPNVNRVKSYFSNLNIKQKKGPVEKDGKEPSIPQLKEMLQERDLPHGPETLVLKTILWLCDRVNITETEDDDNDEIIDYSTWKKEKLKAEIHRRGLTVKTEKERLQLLLRLSDMYNEEED